MASLRLVADVCYFINSRTVEFLAKNKDVVASLDKHSLDTFGPLMDKLSENMQLAEARAVAIRFVVALVRATIGKGSKELGFPVGKIGAMPWGEEKIMAIKKSWATWAERGHPSAKSLKLALGFKDDDPDQDQGEVTEEALDFPGDLEKDPPVPMTELSFKIEDTVEVTRRFTIKIPIPGDAALMRDIGVGTLARVLSWAADDHSKCNIEMDLEIATLHLDEEADQDDGGDTGTSIPKAPKHDPWLNGHLDEADHTKITVVKNWKAWNHRHDEDADTVPWFARGASLVCLRMGMEQLPTYTDKDFLVVNRLKKDRKEHTQEVWTLKKFNPG